MRNKLYILSLIFMLPLTSFAQETKEQNLKETAANGNKTGDNKFTNSAFINRPGTTSFITTDDFQFPQDPLGWTSDFENILTKAQINELDSIIAKFEKETGIEIAIVTIDSVWTAKENFDEMVTAIGGNWGIGKAGLDNGIVIGISIGLRTIRISNGAGVEQKLTNSETKKIIDQVIIAEFKKGEYFEGIRKGLLRIIQKVK